MVSAPPATADRAPPTPVWMEAARGELRRATALARVVLADAAAPTHATAGAHLALGIVGWAQDRLAEAAAETEAAVVAAERAGRSGLAVVARLHGALVTSSAGEHVAAIGTVLDVQRRMLDDPRTWPLRTVVDEVDASVHLAAGAVDRAEALYDRLPESADRMLVGARIALQRARFATALHRAEGVLRTEGTDRRQRIEALLIASLADDARGEHEVARRRRAALAELTVPEGVRRPYLDLGVVLPGEPEPDRSPWLPLSDREQQVLRHLQARHDNQEIAEAMYISVNTVKTHLQSTYRKLGVQSRRQAVERAVALGLL